MRTKKRTLEARDISSFKEIVSYCLSDNKEAREKGFIVDYIKDEIKINGSYSIPIRDIFVSGTKHDEYDMIKAKMLDNDDKDEEK